MGKILLYILLTVIAVFLMYILLLVISAALVNTKKEYTHHSRFYRFLLSSSTAIGLKIVRIKLHITGMEKMPQNGRFLMVCNHRSKFDPLIAWHIFRRNQLSFVSKPENFNVPIWGRLIRRCCFLAIDREHPRHSMETLNKAVELINQDEVSIGIYPEGTRSKSGELLPFHNGIFKVAKKANVPIIVTAIRGTEKIAKNYPWHRSHVYLDVIEVIDTDFVATHRTFEIGDRVRNDIEQQLQKN
ncbi:MAG: lysophospholipid acyltransferase family protein [Acutalibacteraceae bacterium]